MLSIEEKRVYDDQGGVTEAYVASGVGLVRVSVANDIVGEFTLVSRGTARDVAAEGRAVAVATDEDILISTREDNEDLEPTDFGPAVAVGYADGDLLAASPEGRIAHHRDGEWVDLETPTLEVRAIDGDLLATDKGVFRVRGDEVTHAGLEDARDVSAAGVPLAATADGLYKLGNGWMKEYEGSVDVVVADPRNEPGDLEVAHAAAGANVYAYDDDEWLELPPATGPVAAIGHGETVYAVTDGGEFLVAGEAGELSDVSRSPTEAATGQWWRSRTLGVTDVRGLAVPEP
ncbi:HVO_0234 family beta-propeller protein [Natrialbaceae archaeon A-gly3]